MDYRGEHDPAVVGGFASLASLDQPSLGQILALAVAGWTIATTWLVIAENHRAFQDHSVAWLRAIERCWGMTRDTAPKASAAALVRPGMIRTARFALWWLITIGAMLTVLFWPGGLLAR